MHKCKRYSGALTLLFLFSNCGCNDNIIAFSSFILLEHIEKRIVFKHNFYLILSKWYGKMNGTFYDNITYLPILFSGFPFKNTWCCFKSIHKHTHTHANRLSYWSLLLVIDYYYFLSVEQKANGNRC